MITDETFPVEPWRIRETDLDQTLLEQAESLFALSNGHIGLRGNLDEGEPFGLPGTYLNGFYEKRPLPYAEAGYGYPEDGQTLINVTNGKIIRLLVDDEPFDVRTGELAEHERVLDMRAGALARLARWRSPRGKQVKVTSTRLVSLPQRSVVAIEYDVEALDESMLVTLQSELVANEDQPAPSADPRVAAGSDSGADWARTLVICRLQPGEHLRIVKYLGYGWSPLRSSTALVDDVAGAVAQARYTGWQGLCEAQRAFLDDFWDCADVEVEGDPQCQQAVHFGLFHLLQASARAEGRAIPAKGLTGHGYDGHAFWDTEGYVLPVLTYTAPYAAADALRWRASILDPARQRAAELGLAGASFPWRTITGPECSGYWPAGTAAWHVNADIAMAFERYRIVTGDESLEAECGLQVLVETARLWVALGHYDRHGVWHLDGTGPDEYTAMVRDNLFTNLMAAHNLRTAADACTRHPEAARAMGVTSQEIAAWRDAADAVCVPYDEELGVHEQCAG